VLTAAVATLMLAASPGSTGMQFAVKQSNESANVTVSTAGVVADPADNATAASVVVAPATNKQAVNATAVANSSAAVVAPATGKQANGTAADAAPAGNSTGDMNTDYMAMTFGELATQISQVQPEAEAKQEEANAMEDGPPKDEAKVLLHQLKTKLHELKGALRYKKDHKPTILMTAAGEPMPKRSDAEEIAQRNASAAQCTSLGGHIADQQSSMCCATVCTKCGGGNPEEEQCKGEVIKAAKICAPGSTVPCMVRFIPTQESKDADTKWKLDQGITDKAGAVVGAVDSDKPWWHIWAAAAL